MADPFCRNRRRIRELTEVLRWRYDGEMSDDDAGRADARLMFDHFMALPEGEKKSRAFQSLWCPWLSGPELSDMLREAARAGRRWTAEAVGVELNLDYALRQELGITTIAAADVTPAEAAQLRLKRRAEQARRRRARTPKRRLTPPPGPLSPRGEAILAALSAIGTWTRKAALRKVIVWLPCFRGLTAESFRKIVNVEIAALIAANLVESEDAETKRAEFKIRSKPVPTGSVGYAISSRETGMPENRNRTETGK